MQLNGSLDFLEKKLCSLKSTRSLNSLVAAAETRLQELNQLTAEIMDTISTTQERQNMNLTCHFTKKYVSLETHSCLHTLYKLLKVTTLYFQLYRQILDEYQLNENRQQ